MTSTASRADAAAIPLTSSTAAGVSTIAHSRVRSGAPWRSIAATSVAHLLGGVDLRYDDAVGACRAGRGEVVLVPLGARSR